MLCNPAFAKICHKDVRPVCYAITPQHAAESGPVCILYTRLVAAYRFTVQQGEAMYRDHPGNATQASGSVVSHRVSRGPCVSVPITPMALHLQRSGSMESHPDRSR